MSTQRLDTTTLQKDNPEAALPYVLVPEPSIGAEARLNDEFQTTCVTGAQPAMESGRLWSPIRRTVAALIEGFIFSCGVTTSAFIMTTLVLTGWFPETMMQLRSRVASALSPPPASAALRVQPPTGLVPNLEPLTGVRERASVLPVGGIVTRELDPAKPSEIMIGEHFPALVRFPAPITAIRNHQPRLTVRKTTPSELSIECRDNRGPDFVTGAIWVDLATGETVVLHLSVTSIQFLGKTDILTFTAPTGSGSGKPAQPGVADRAEPDRQLLPTGKK